MTVIKKWLQDRWPLLDAALESLTVETEIEAVCLAEIEYFRKDRGLSLGTLGNVVSQTKQHLEARFGAEHISTKYMNLSKEEWAARIAPTNEKKEQHLQDRQFINEPDAVVARAVSLLTSDYWQDITVALAVLTGRRLREVLEVGAFLPRTRYTLTFSGQLKKGHEKIMLPYEIPVLAESTLVLAGVDRLRSLVGSEPVNEDSLGGVADKHFSDLIPPRAGGSLYVHLFRAVWGSLAVFFFCPARILDTVYLNRAYGHYWILEAGGQLQADYESTMHYQDYAVSDAAILKHGGRQGVLLAKPGVTVLEIFQEKPEQLPTKKGGHKMAEQVTVTKTEGGTEYSMIKPKKTTKGLVDQFIEQEKITASSPYDAAILLLLKRNGILGTVTGYGVDVESLAASLAAAAAVDDSQLQSLVTVLANLEAVAALLVDASADSETPITYLGDVLKQRRDLKASYDGRHKKDYSTMSTSELRKHKTEEASFERFGRAVAAIIAYNKSVELAELRWYINAAIVTDLVGGSPTMAREWLKTRSDVAKHHEQYKLSPGFNRRGVPVTDRITVPELPVVEAVEPEKVETEQAAEE